ncbi:hypothetical protein BDN72DRAFT_835663 [Pluteus cervinus]|uniref:Uncharacterized protein n=1 Tax=Pluteus cervinus TaxID=181527 RepID=A0ACD3B3V1_9AGAR|nr:hypothetical protein BDN72DRAFT_835663 [Pluteus cervinus]
MDLASAPEGHKRHPHWHSGFIEVTGADHPRRNLPLIPSQTGSLSNAATGLQLNCKIVWACTAR